MKDLHSFFGARLPRRGWGGVDGDEIDMTEQPVEQPCQLDSLLARIVHALCECVFEGDAATRALDIIPRGSHQLLEGIAPVDGH